MQISTQTPGTSESPKKPEIQINRGAVNAAQDPGTTPLGPEMANRTSEYLKILTRMEAMLKRGDLPEVVVEGFAKAIDKELKALSEKEMSTLRQMSEVRNLKLDNTQPFQQELVNAIRIALQEKSKSEPVLELLRHPEFAKLMKGANRGVGNYTPQSLATGKPTPSAAPLPGGTPPSPVVLSGVPPSGSPNPTPSPQAAPQVTQVAPSSAGVSS